MQVFDTLRSFDHFPFDGETISWDDLKKEQQNRMPWIIEGIILLEKLKKEELNLMSKIRDEDNKENRNLAQLSAKIVRLKNLIRSAYVLPTLMINNKLPVYHIFHIKFLIGR